MLDLDSNDEPSVVPSLSPAGRGAVAAFIGIFALAGFAGALDGLYDSRHGPNLSDYLLVVLSTFIGAWIARVLLSDTRHMYVLAIAVHALVGVYVGFRTRPHVFWYPAAPNAAWVAAFTLGAALSGTLWTRFPPEGIGRGFLIRTLMGLVLIVLLILSPGLLRHC